MWSLDCSIVQEQVLSIPWQYDGEMPWWSRSIVLVPTFWSRHTQRTSRISILGSQYYYSSISLQWQSKERVRKILKVRVWKRWIIPHHVLIWHIVVPWTRTDLCYDGSMTCFRICDSFYVPLKFWGEVVWADSMFSDVLVQTGRCRYISYLGIPLGRTTLSNTLRERRFLYNHPITLQIDITV